MFNYNLSKSVKPIKNKDESSFQIKHEGLKIVETFNQGFWKGAAALSSGAILSLP